MMEAFCTHPNVGAVLVVSLGCEQFNRPRLMQLIAGQVGSLVNSSEWASILGIGRDTVASYVEILEASHIVATLPPYAAGKRSELTSRPKVYLVSASSAEKARQRVVSKIGDSSKIMDVEPA